MKGVDWGAISYAAFLSILCLCVTSCLMQTAHESHEYDMAKMAQARK